MSLKKASLKHGWKLFISIYLVLLFISNVLINLSDTETPSIKSITKQTDSWVLYFSDPLITKNEIVNEVSKSKNFIYWSYSSEYADLSYQNQAKLAANYLDSIGVISVHVLGEAVGGGPAIHFSSKYPEKTKSLSLINAIGVTELELLGGYHLNHALYRTKHVFFMTIKYLVPHFGLFGNLNEKITRAKIQLDSDQRLIRTNLNQIKIPVLIQQFDESGVSLELAKEHARLLPQSMFKFYENQDGKEKAASDLAFYLMSVEDKTLDSEISSLREVQSLLPFDISNNVSAEGKALLILMIVIVLSTLISEDLTCIGTGLLIARGLIGFFPGLFACLFGIFFGDILVYLSGKWLASSTLHKAPLKWFINEKDVEKSYHWFEAKGPAIIIASRFIPGTRFPTYFSAGAIGASFWMFIFYFGVASILWTPALVGLAAISGQKMLSYFNLYQDYALWVLLGFFIVAYLLFKILIPMFTFRGRRVLLGKWKRITNWEFWPPFIVYLPVFIYIIGLWIKFRSFTMFTLANPAIPEGGFIRESKIGILKNIKTIESVAKFGFIEGEESDEKKKDIVDSFIKENNLNYPIVIKPDVGERGKGVNIIKDEEELNVLIPNLSTGHVIQEFIEGEEFGVFYYRFPDQSKGKVFSITKKVYLKLTGDGKHTLEELILKDSRAVCMAKYHFDQHIDDLYEIPEKGKIIKLVELGTHSRGAVFYDGSELQTEKLVEEIDRISKSFEGFYFGRYDIKVPSKDHLKRGAGIKVIEVNGVTSESTNIYDPSHSFFYGIRTLMKQWRIAFEIGKQVKENNPSIKTPSVSHLLSLLR